MFWYVPTAFPCLHNPHTECPSGTHQENSYKLFYESCLFGELNLSTKIFLDFLLLYCESVLHEEVLWSGFSQKTTLWRCLLLRSRYCSIPEVFINSRSLNKFSIILQLIEIVDFIGRGAKSSRFL